MSDVQHPDLIVPASMTPDPAWRPGDVLDVRIGADIVGRATVLDTEGHLSIAYDAAAAPLLGIELGPLDEEENPDA